MYICVYIYILWLATKLHNSSISRDLIIVPTILCKCAVWSTLWTSWSRFETGKWGRGRTARAPVCNNNETTAHQHCGAVTKSMSNCIRAAALQQWAFKLIWLAVKPHAGARAHTRGHTRTPPSAQTRARADTETHTHARTHIHTHTHTYTHAGLNTEHGQSEAISPHALVWGEKVEGAAEAFYLERFVVGSLITIHSLISPNLLK